MIEFCVDGKPVGKQRPRLGKNGKFYTPKKTQQYEKLVAQLALAARNGARRFKPFEDNISVQIIISHSANKIADIDNIIKSILDGMNKIIYHDDKQVAEVKCVRIKSNLERTCVKIAQFTHA